MGIHQTTLKVIKNNKLKFSKNLYKDIQTIIELALNYSPLSDIHFLVDKAKANIKHIDYPPSDRSWMPIRNVIRIIGKISDENDDKEIDRIYIESMYCGCDYFQGTISILKKNGTKVSGDYKWHWTAFPGYDRHYDKFTLFPNLILNSKKEVIAN